MRSNAPSPSRCMLTFGCTSEVFFGFGLIICNVLKLLWAQWIAHARTTKWNAEFSSFINRFVNGFGYAFLCGACTGLARTRYDSMSSIRPPSNEAVEGQRELSLAWCSRPCFVYMDINLWFATRPDIRRSLGRWNRIHPALALASL